MAVGAAWSNGVLVVIGDAAADTISLARDVAGALIVKSGVIPIPIQNPPEGGATVANTTSILVYGFDGDDTISIDDANGAMPFAYLNGGEGVDRLNGGHGVEWLDGAAGGDLLVGGGGADYMLSDAPELNDQYFWTVGDGSDLVDTFTFVRNSIAGTSNADTLLIVGAPNFSNAYIFCDETDELVLLTKGMFKVEVSSGGGNDVIVLSEISESIINAGDGDDIVIAAADSSNELTGGAGNDYLVGGLDGDTLSAGTGSDVLTGGGGDDEFLMFGTQLGVYDIIVDFSFAQNDYINTDFVEAAFTQVGDHVFIGGAAGDFSEGIFVLNAIAAQVQARTD